MADLPDELWRRILEFGVEKPKKLLSYKDLCCLSMASRRLNKLSSEEPLWSSLISSDFPQYDRSNTHAASVRKNSPSSKTLYKIRFERDRAWKLAAHRRAVLRIESQIAENLRKQEEVQLQKKEEREKMKATVSELSNLHRARHASVALNVWQPEVVRGCHKQIVEQSPIPADSRIHALEMELKLCKQQIVGLDKAHRDEGRRLEAAKKQLASMKYHPLRDHDLTGDEVAEHGIKRKNLKKEHINILEDMAASIGAASRWIVLIALVAPS